MFCGNAPCTCNAKTPLAPKAKAAEVATVTAPPLPNVKYSNHITTGPKFNKDTEDSTMTYAVNVFLDANILSKTETFRLKNRFGRTIPSSIKTRLTRWKERNNAKNS